MIRTVDVSNWTTPYDTDVFDWSEIAGGWERMRRAGLAGDPMPCDFSAGPIVSEIQAALGVPPTGVFDAATCQAWHEHYGEAPNAEALTSALIGTTCSSAVVPSCPEVRSTSPWLYAAAAAGIAAVAYLAMKGYR